MVWSKFVKSVCRTPSVFLLIGGAVIAFGGTVLFNFESGAPGVIGLAVILASLFVMADEKKRGLWG